VVALENRILPSVVMAQWACPPRGPLEALRALAVGGAHLRTWRPAQAPGQLSTVSKATVSRQVYKGTGKVKPTPHARGDQQPQRAWCVHGNALKSIAVFPSKQQWWPPLEKQR